MGKNERKQMSTKEFGTLSQPHLLPVLKLAFLKYCITNSLKIFDTLTTINDPAVFPGPSLFEC